MSARTKRRALCFCIVRTDAVCSAKSIFFAHAFCSLPMHISTMNSPTLHQGPVAKYGPIQKVPEQT